MATAKVSPLSSHAQFPTNPDTMLVALYARVSTKDKGQETENQLRQLRDFAMRSGWTIVVEYVDHESGKHSDREQFEQMFRDASQRKFDVLLFWSLDRLSREGVLPTLQHLQRLTGYGIGYRSFSEQYFDSCGIFRDAVIAIVATVAKQERICISERVRAGLTRHATKASGWGVAGCSFPAPASNPCAKQGCPGARLRRSSIPTQPLRDEPQPQKQAKFSSRLTPGRVSRTAPVFYCLSRKHSSQNLFSNKTGKSRHFERYRLDSVS